MMHGQKNIKSFFETKTEYIIRCAQKVKLRQAPQTQWSHAHIRTIKRYGMDRLPLELSSTSIFHKIFTEVTHHLYYSLECEEADYRIEQNISMCHMTR